MRSGRRIALGALVAMGIVAGCSKEDDVPATTDAGVAPLPGPNRAAPPEEVAEAPKTCRERCTEAHPTAAAKDRAIETCWSTHCAGPCFEGLSDDAEAGAPDAGSCAAPVVTVSSSCDRCTSAACCAAWDGCFQDAECSALNDCYRQCLD